MFIKSALYTCRLQPTGVTDYNVFAIKVSISNVFSQKNAGVRCKTMQHLLCTKRINAGSIKKQSLQVTCKKIT